MSEKPIILSYKSPFNNVQNTHGEIMRFYKGFNRKTINTNKNTKASEWDLQGQRHFSLVTQSDAVQIQIGRGL